jgi:hypothetical protein
VYAYFSVLLNVAIELSKTYHTLRVGQPLESLSGKFICAVLGRGIVFFWGGAVKQAFPLDKASDKLYTLSS